MTQTQAPEFSIHDRCRKAREFAELEQLELAAKIEVSRGTVSNYENGTVAKLKTPVLRRWAIACGVPFEWLMNGEIVLSDEDTLSSRWTTPDTLAA